MTRFSTSLETFRGDAYLLMEPLLDESGRLQLLQAREVWCTVKTLAENWTGQQEAPDEDALERTTGRSEGEVRLEYHLTEKGRATRRC